MRRIGLDQLTAWILAVIVGLMVAGGFYFAFSQYIIRDTAKTQSEVIDDIRKIPVQTEWAYYGSQGPERWSVMEDRYKPCGANVGQSPINIEGWRSDRLMLPLRVKLRDEVPVDWTYDQRQLVGKLKVPGLLEYDGLGMDLEKIVLQFPSEHQLRGLSFPGEAQLHFYSAKRRLLIISIFIDTDANLSHLQGLDAVSEALKGQSTSDLLDLKMLWPDDRRYFHYVGSLSYPPCVENVTRLVLRAPIQWPAKIVSEYRNVLGRNVRPVQDTKGRTIRLSER